MLLLASIVPLAAAVKHAGLQAALGILFFVDDSWRKHLPGDATGEAAEVRFLNSAGTQHFWTRLVVYAWTSLGRSIAYLCHCCTAHLAPSAAAQGSQPVQARSQLGYADHRLLAQEAGHREVGGAGCAGAARATAVPGVPPQLRPAARAGGCQACPCTAACCHERCTPCSPCCCL